MYVGFHGIPGSDSHYWRDGIKVTGPWRTKPNKQFWKEDCGWSSVVDGYLGSIECGYYNTFMCQRIPPPRKDPLPDGFSAFFCM